jgi:hypothetical protein
MDAAEREQVRLELARALRGRDPSEVLAFRLLDRASAAEGFGRISGECCRCGALLRVGDDALCLECEVSGG